MFRLVVAFLALVSSVALGSGKASAEPKAFIVAINNYASLPKLKTAISDATAVAEKLKASGFKTTLLIDPSLRTFSEAWKKFVLSIRNDDLALTYFAGHGVQVEGLNFLLMKDTSVATSDLVALKQNAISFHDMMEQLELQAPLATVYVLDACRDNPFGAKSKLAGGQTRGLAKIESVYGAFVLYSAGAGEQAIDFLEPADKNSLFARHLLPVLNDKSVSLLELTKRLQLQVEEAARTKANHTQRPAYFDGVLGQLFLADIGNPFRAGKPLELATNERIIYMSKHAQWASRLNCKPHGPPKLRVLKQPQYGRIVTRFQKNKVESIVAGDAKCIGTEQRFLNLYYVMDEPHLGSALVDTFQVALVFDEAGNNFTRVLEFKVDLKQKAAPYSVLRSR